MGSAARAGIHAPGLSGATSRLEPVLKSINDLVAAPEPVSSTRDHLRPSGKLLSLGGIWAHLEYGLKRARLQWYSGGLGETSFNVRIAGLRVCGGHIACDRCCGLRDRW